MEKYGDVGGTIPMNWVSVRIIQLRMMLGTRGIHEEKQKVIDEAQKALDKISESGDEEAIAAATLELQGAQSSLRIAPVEWVPEPVRVSLSFPSDLPFHLHSVNLPPLRLFITNVLNGEYR
jgi:hypothetical protein